MLSYLLPSEWADMRFSLRSLTVQPHEKSKLLPQPMHRLETSEGSPCRVEGLKPPLFGMFFFTRKWPLSMQLWGYLAA